MKEIAKKNSINISKCEKSDLIRPHKCNTRNSKKTPIATKKVQLVQTVQLDIRIPFTLRFWKFDIDILIGGDYKVYNYICGSYIGRILLKKNLTKNIYLLNI